MEPGGRARRAGSESPKRRTIIRLRQLLWAGVLLSGSLLGCASSRPRAATLTVSTPQPVDVREERKLAPEVEADARGLVEANNRFALDIYSQQRTQTGNLFLSPYSISTAFGMLWAGAAGKTEEEMASVLHFPLAQEKLHPTFGALQRSLDRGIQLGGYELRIANRVVGAEGVPIPPGFPRYRARGLRR